MDNSLSTQVLYNGQLALATAEQSGTIVGGGGPLDLTCLVQTENGKQLALKTFSLTGGGGDIDVIRIVDTLPETGDSKYLYGVLMDDLDRDGYGIIQFFVWHNNAWYATGAYSIDIDPSTLVYKENFQYDSSTGVLNIIIE